MAAIRFAIVLALTAIAGCGQAMAEVVAIEVKEQRPWLAGRQFKAGEYELISGIVRYEVDPAAPSSRDIIDVKHLPKNGKGMVEFYGPFLVLRPSDPGRANGTTIVEVANRGITQMQGLLTEADSLALLGNATKDVSRPVLFDRGYTFAWAAWQGDLRVDEFGLQVPEASVSGAVRSSNFVEPGEAFYGEPLEQHAACAADANDPTAILRIQHRIDDPGTIVPRSKWRFARKDKGGKVVEDPCAFLLQEPLYAPALISITFKGTGAKAISLGQAAIRDFTSHLKYHDVGSALNSRPGGATRVIGYGYSQSARFLRDFLYRGFNTDARRRPVFDGVLDVAAGAGRGSFNHRFAVPGLSGNSVGSVLRPADLYPFADTPTPDIDGRGREGLLDRAKRDNAQPRIFHILTSSEYWARAGSLLHTSTDGRTRLPEAVGTRTYAFAGTAHGPRRHSRFLVKATAARLPYNDNTDLFLALPALLVAMDKWISVDEAPPVSRHPRLGDTLVQPSALRFPATPNVVIPAETPPLWQLRLGPEYRSKGIIQEPPELGPRYPLLVPQVDADGNELGSWRGMAVSVPLGTYTAWNYQFTGMEAFGYLSGLQGAFVPFAATKIDREKAGDPRLSVEERYGGLNGFMRTVDTIADEQIAAGFLLEEEKERAVMTMRLAWDRVTDLRSHWPRSVP